MPSGLLELHGTIDIAQFWPTGDSDADTTKVIVDVGGNAFRFRKDSNSAPHPTHVFDNAKVKGRTTKAPITNGKTGRVRWIKNGPVVPTVQTYLVLDLSRRDVTPGDQIDIDFVNPLFFDQTGARVRV